MSQLRMTFRGVLPSERVCALAEARYWKVRSQWSDMSSCDVVIERSALAADQAPRYSALVKLEGHASGLSASADAQHPNPCAAVRAAFLRASSQVSTPAAAAPRRGHLRLVR